MTTPTPINAQASAPKTILFAGHDLKFIRGFIEHCQNKTEYKVLIDEHPGHQITNPAKSLELLPLADVIFCEWCLGNAKWYSQRKRPEQRLLIRVHHQEMELSYRWELQWDNVDSIIFTNRPHYERFCAEQAQQSAKAVLVYCNVDCDRLDQEKLPSAEFNLGLVGINPMRKRPDLALEILRRLHRSDSRYTLYFKTRMPWEYKWLWDRPHERDYFNDLFARIESSPLRDSIIFEAHGDDMPLWYSKIGFILSTSDHEGSHQAVAEGMASGCIPIIRNWNGAAPLYPARFVFSSVDEAVELVREWRKPPSYATAVKEAKAYTRENFHEGKIYRQFEALFTKETSSRRSSVDGVEVFAATPAISKVMILSYLPPGFRGGYRIRIEQEIKVLTRQGYEVHLACFHPEEVEAASLDAHRAELGRLGCKVNLVPMKGFFDVKLNDMSVRGPLETLQRIIRENNLSLVQAEALYCTRIGLLLKERQPSLRLIFDCHGTSPEEEQMGGAHPSRVTAMREWERRALTETDLNVFVSEAMHQFYRKEYGFRKLRNVIVPCCVAEERFPDPKMLPALPLPANRPVLAYAGTMAAWQCGEEMIRLFAQVQRQGPDTFFLMLVPKTDHQKAREKLLKHQLPEESVLLAELNHDQVAPTLQRTHAGVLLRRTHPVNRVSSPTKFGEYLAAGIPVIMTEGIGDFSGMAKREGIGLLLKPELLDLDNLPSKETARILDFVRESMRQRRQMADRCRSAATEHLHWDQSSTTLLNAYRKLLTKATNGVTNSKPR